MTIKDIAAKAGVSIGAVHCALAGKTGVGEETRLRIIDIARLMNYRPNSIAASLKRKTVRIVAALPGSSNENRYYFSYVWEGLHDCLASMQDFNIEVTEVPYYNDVEGQNEVLGKLQERTDIDGLLTIGYMDSGCRMMLRRFLSREIPIVLVGSDINTLPRLCCVQPNYDVVGRTLGELMAWQESDGGILLCAGNALTPSHFQIVQGVEAYFQDNGIRRPLYKLHDNGKPEDVYRAIMTELSRRTDITVCCCVNARNSVMLGRALESTGRAGSMPAIGCDVFSESIEFLENGTFTNLIHKNPYSQAYMATKCLADYLLRGIKPQETLYVGSEIVFRSSLPMLRSGQRSLHAVIA